MDLTADRRIMLRNALDVYLQHHATTCDQCNRHALRYSQPEKLCYTGQAIVRLSDEINNAYRKRQKIA